VHRAQNGDYSEYNDAHFHIQRFIEDPDHRHHKHYKDVESVVEWVIAHSCRFEKHDVCRHMLHNHALEDHHPEPSPLPWLFSLVDHGVLTTVGKTHDEHGHCNVGTSLKEHDVPLCISSLAFKAFLGEYFIKTIEDIPS
jgi:hypothetical protein